MLESFIFSVNTSLPVFLCVLLGALLNKLRMFDVSFWNGIDKYVFKIALPFLLFKDMAVLDVRHGFDIKLVCFCALTSLVMFTVVWLFAYIFIKEKASVGAFVQGACRGSAAILGLVLVNNIYGSDGKAPLMILGAVPLFNIMSVIFLTFSSKDEHSNVLNDVGKAFLNILKNPIIIGLFAGFLVSLLNIPLPEVVFSPVKSISATATPLALLSIGATFKLSKAKEKMRITFVASFIKLFALPVVFLTLAAILGFRGDELVAIFVMLGSPTAATSYVMAKNMKNDYVLSSGIIMLTTLLSMISITFFVFIMKYLALI